MLPVVVVPSSSINVVVVNGVVSPTVFCLAVVFVKTIVEVTPTCGDIGSFSGPPLPDSPPFKIFAVKVEVDTFDITVDVAVVLVFEVVVVEGIVCVVNVGIVVRAVLMVVHVSQRTGHRART